MTASIRPADNTGKLVKGKEAFATLAARNPTAPTDDELHFCVGHQLPVMRTEVNLWRDRAPGLDTTVPVDPDAWGTDCGYAHLRKEVSDQEKRKWTMQPGEALLVAIAAGGRLHLRAAGSQSTIDVSSTTVAHIVHPPAASLLDIRGSPTMSITVTVSRPLGSSCHFLLEGELRQPDLAPATVPVQPNERAAHEGNNEDFWAWAIARINERAGAALPPLLSLCPAANCAAEALGVHYGLNDVARGALSLWIRERILRLDTYVEEDRWQWDVSLVAWVFQQSGALQVCQWDFARLSGLYARAGVSASLQRSQPFRDWQNKKRDEYGAHKPVGGMKSLSDKEASRYTRMSHARFKLTVAQLGFLEAAVHCHRLGHPADQPEGTPGAGIGPPAATTPTLGRTTRLKTRRRGAPPALREEPQA